MTETSVKLMRQSTIGSGDICLQRLDYDIRRPRNVGSEARAKGTAFHAGVEHIYRTGDINLPVMKALASEALATEVGLSKDGFFWKTDFGTCEGMLHKMLDHYVEKENYWDLSKFTVVAVEWRFDQPWIPGWHRSGTVDLIMVGPDGWIYIVDHKTGGSKWREGKEKARQTPQPIWYTEAVLQWWHDTYGEDRPSTFYFDITYQSMKTGKVGFDRRVATWSQHQQEMVHHKAEGYARLVDAGGPFFPNQQHYLCHHEYCDHWSICPYGEEFNRANI